VTTMSTSPAGSQDPGSDESLPEQAARELGYDFQNPDFIERALTHASISESRLESNERLEFLGDAVLGLIACHRIYELFPDLLEGEMTKIKSVVVSRRACAVIARRLNLAGLLRLGKGIRSARGSLPQSMNAAALEAVIAAVYLDGGFDAAAAWLGPHIDPLIIEAEASGHQHNFKSMLQQHVQHTIGGTPDYVILEEGGPDHAKTFRIAVRVGKDLHEPATGSSKKQAEQQAALLALSELGLIETDEDGQIRTVQA